MAEYWNTEDDIENDFYEISDICSKLPKPAPSPSKYMIKLRGKKSIYDDLDDEDERDERQECVPVRGYPVNRNGIKQPGGKPSFIDNHTSTLIREVSGFGYSNDLIEHSLRETVESGEHNAHKMPNLTFQSAKTTSHGKFTLVKGTKPDSSPDRASTSSSRSSSSPRNQSTPSPQFNKPTNGVNGRGINIFNRKDFPDLR